MVSKLFKSIFSFELIFLLFLFSYQFKNAYQPFSDYNITLVLALVSIIMAVIIYRRESTQPFWDIPTIVMLAFGAWAIGTAFYTDNYNYPLGKALSLLLYTLPGFLIARHVIGPRAERSENFANVAILFAVVVAAEGMRIFANNCGAIGYVWGNNYLVTGQSIGTGLLCLFAYMYYHRPQQILEYPIYIFCSVIFAFLVYISMHLGGRGPVLALAITAILSVVYSLFFTKHRRWMPLVTAWLGAVSAGFYYVANWYFTVQICQFVQRMVPILDPEQIDAPVAERLDYYQSAMRCFLESPIFGVGLGDWPHCAGLGDIELHPHNIFLEILSELGLVGMLLAGTFAVVMIIRTPSKHFLRDRVNLTIALLASFSFLNALKSGDFNDNILFFVCLGLLVGVRRSANSSSPILTKWQ